MSKFLFSALALSFGLSLIASFVVAMTVIPLFCSKYMKSCAGRGTPHPAGSGNRTAGGHGASWGGRFNAAFNRAFNRFLDLYERRVRRALERRA